MVASEITLMRSVVPTMLNRPTSGRARLERGTTAARATSARMAASRSPNAAGAGRPIYRKRRRASLMTKWHSRLFRATNWYHFHQDEIDRLDAAVERLFPELLER